MSAVASGSKGNDLEESLKSYFWHAGYFVVRGLRVRIDGEDITDVDLWLYERPTAATRRRLIVDIKNRKSPKASERLIWVRGLQEALGVDGAIVATTDKRLSSRKLSKRLSVTLLDGDAISKITNSQFLKQDTRVSSEEIENLVKRIDANRRSSDWRETLQEVRASLIIDIGVHSTNKALAASSFFAEQTVLAQPSSEQMKGALRLFYHTTALAALSLDFMLADQAFRSPEERRKSIVGGIRFGQSDTTDTLSAIQTAIGLARRYADNGLAVAKQVEYGFSRDADNIPAEIIADYVARISPTDALFNIARELERGSTSIDLPSYDSLSAEAKSLLGVFLDFNGISREKLAEAWQPIARTKVSDTTVHPEPELGPLFSRDEEIPLPSKEPPKKHSGNN